MKKLYRLPIIIIVGLTFLGRISASDAKQDSMVTISGHVLGASGTHTVYVMLLDSAGFEKQPVRQLRLQPDSVYSFSFSVAPGRWAISAFEDRNDNSMLDMGFFGPKEPSGFWRPLHAKRKPLFDDVASQIDHSISDVDVKLR
jgi:uncharacterized protein (DUF2141 family)